jgi:hypothetical protein
MLRSFLEFESGDCLGLNFLILTVAAEAIRHRFVPYMVIMLNS